MKERTVEEQLIQLQDAFIPLKLAVETLEELSYLFVEGEPAKDDEEFLEDFSRLVYTLRGLKSIAEEEGPYRELLKILTDLSTRRAAAIRKEFKGTKKTGIRFQQ